MRSLLTFKPVNGDVIMLSKRVNSDIAQLVNPDVTIAMHADRNRVLELASHC